MGQDDEIPDKPIFAKVELKGLEPGRFAAYIENEHYTTRSITRAISQFVIKENDILMAVNPRVGDELLLRMLRLVNAKNDEEFEMIKIETESTVPWIESSYVDGNMEVFNAPQLGLRKIFKTHMTHQSMNATKPNSPFQVTMVRHPLDLRVSFYKYMKDCYVRCGGKGGAKYFTENYSLDDFVDIPSTTSHIIPQAKILTYEHNILEWYKLSQKAPNKVLVLCYEECLIDPTHCINRLASFLGVKLSDARVKEIVSDLQRRQLIIDGFDALDGFAVNNAGTHTSLISLDDIGRERAGTVSDRNAYLYHNYRSLEKMWEAWKRALETVKWLDGPKDYEEFYHIITGRSYSFPKTFPPKPPKSGPLDDLARKCTIM